MLREAFDRVYTKFKLHFYGTIFEGFASKEVSLTTVEIFCIEIIYALGSPTVAEFAHAANISSPNAAYKINNLVKKGYLKKVQSETDKREYHLEVTEKFLNYYSVSSNYRTLVMKRVEERFTPEEIETFKKIMEVMANELMPEIEI